MAELITPTQPNNSNDPISGGSTPTADSTEMTPQNPNNGSMPKKSRKKIVLIVILILVVLGGAAAAYFILGKKDAAPTTPQPASSQTNAESDTKVVNGRTWFLKPKAVTGYSFFEDGKTYAERTIEIDESKDADTIKQQRENREQTAADFAYYLVGKTADGKEIIRATVASEGPSMSGPPSGLIVADSKDKGSLLVKHSSMLYYEGKYSMSAKMGTGVTEDATTEFSEINIPKQLTYGKITLAQPTEYQQIESIAYQVNKKTGDTHTYTQLEVTDQGTLYKDVSKAEQDWEIQQYKLRTLDSQAVFLQDVVKDVEPGALQLEAGGKNEDTYGTYSSGCGIGTMYTVLIRDPANLKPYAKDATGKTYYTFYETNSSSTSEALLQKFFTESKQFYQDDAKVPKDALEFNKLVPILLVRNQANQLTALFRERLAPAGGCAKPVVYLYPTTPTEVSVRVGADVTVSEPAYNQGWKALARPSGFLNVNGKSYDSLFWEGYGHGAYPDVKQSGIVVKQSEVRGTVNNHLRQLGFNNKERADFMAFWEKRLPNDPFVRITWLGTADMEQLAPLTITPRPDTLIRAFIDAEGLPSYKKLTPQRLTAPARTGFVATEWGGLINGKLQ